MRPPDIQKACTYKNVTTVSDGKTPTLIKYKKPDWRQEYNCGKQYEPSHNLAPTDVTPVLVSVKHFEENDVEDQKLDNASFTTKQPSIDDRLLIPMMWGMIPFWHNGTDYRKHGLTTNNCRLESMLQSKLYGNAFSKGQRCVILCEGFYEWQTTDPKATKSSERSAYYAYMPQKDGVRIEMPETWNERINDLNLLKIAGLFDSWTDSNGDRIYSYTVITFESDEKFAWLHHRSPAILETDEQVADWLDFQRVKDTKHLLRLLRPAKELKWHRVSNLVNNSRNK